MRPVLLALSLRKQGCQGAGGTTGEAPHSQQLVVSGPAAAGRLSCAVHGRLSSNGGCWAGPEGKTGTLASPTPTTASEATSAPLRRFRVYQL